MGCSSSAETNDDGSPRHIAGKKNVQSSAPPTPGIVCGYLKKEGAIFTTWKKRFFYLEAGKLSYYESETPDKVDCSHILTYALLILFISNKFCTIIPFYYFVHCLTFNSLIRVIQV